MLVSQKTPLVVPRQSKTNSQKDATNDLNGMSQTGNTAGGRQRGTPGLPQSGLRHCTGIQGACQKHPGGEGVFQIWGEIRTCFHRTSKRLLMMLVRMGSNR